jgi:hypothetical protein
MRSPVSVTASTTTSGRELGDALLDAFARLEGIGPTLPSLNGSIVIDVPNPIDVGVGEVYE